MSDGQTLPPTKAMIGKWSVDRYVSLIRRWSYIGAAIVLIAVLGRQARFVVVIIDLIFISWVGWLIQRRDGGKIEALAGGSFIGIVLGLTASMARFVMHPTLGTGLLVIIESLATTVAAALICVCASIIFTLIRQQKN